MSDYPIVRCPKCSAEQIDMDGFGVLACELCGYCTHPCAEGDPLICQICNATLPDTGQP